MTFLSETPIGLAWIKRFPGNDRETAAALIDEVLLVSRDDLANGLRELLDKLTRQSALAKQKIALYAERPIKKVFGTVPAFFPNSRHGRATGTGVPPIVADRRDQEVGSEGVIAQFITDHCRRNPATAINHPGPTKMRSDKVRKIVILTDFIGSGDRIIRMLESFRYVATLRSWHSYGLIRFVIIAYSGTSEGMARIRLHKWRPDVRIVAGCPTISNTFKGAQRAKVEALCTAFPAKHPEPLGYDDNGALIAFAHGCPNNVPPVLHSRASGWIPLFAGRSTSDSSEAFQPTALDLDQRARRLMRVREARRQLSSAEDDRWISAMLVLAASEAGLRTPEDISSRTRFKLTQVTALVALANQARWLTNECRLTRLGRDELARLRRRRRQTPVLPTETSIFYYPTQLRAP